MCLTVTSSSAMPRPASARLSSRTPKASALSRSSARSFCRIAVRALPVTTEWSHIGLGAAPGRVAISTVVPGASGSERDARRRSTVADTQRLPMSECTA